MKPVENVVFINGLWRTGTTYFWNKVRQNQAWCCYYEPLHEALAGFEPAMNELWTREEVWKQLRHPEMQKGYFHEFPIASSGNGVPLYSASLAYERFILEPGEIHTELEAYFRFLIDHAAGFGKRTCLQPNRMFLRSSWFADRFPATHVYISRDWWDLWRSMLSFQNKYCPSRYYLIATLNASHPWMRPLMDGRILPFAESLTFTDQEAAIQPWFSNSHEVFRIFYHVYVCAAVVNCACAEVVVDVSAPSGSKEMWATVTACLTAQGIASDFSDFRIPVYDRTPEFTELKAITEEVEDMILARLPMIRIPESRIPDWLPGDSALRRLLYRFRAELESSL